ncbi:MAG: 2,3-bisphosphoglycerate-independent phosphoglycerate mutase, partial [Thermodesulfovibrionales bacterium]|nr:2,3-bisphosphoglycerate-independent phosphoglycerate mutase [Thermodesulfovibrionales bacterium]
GHLGVFGYAPLKYQIGRGVLEALGLGLEVKNTDIAARCNYATIKDGLIIDRRAGRISTEKNRELTNRLSEGIKKINETELIFAPGMEHRFAVLIRFPEPLDPDAASIPDTDPQKVGLKPLPPVPKSKNAERTAKIVEELIQKSAEILKNEEKANFILTRGFATRPKIPSLEEVYGLKAVAIAVYPMYRGLASLVGMDTPMIEGGVEEEIKFLKEVYNDYDFFFFHVKKIDSSGEDGDFSGKIAKIEEFDRLLPQILDLNPDVIIITGDHSTPALLKSHSWHPVPVMLKSPYVLGGTCSRFTERECLKGELGIFPAMNLLPLALANTMRLKKYGA